MGVEPKSRLDVRLDDSGCAPGLDFVRALCGDFDLARLAYLKVAPGTDGGNRVYGVCRYPHKDGKTPLTREKYRISCFVQGPFPDGVDVRRRPVYRNDDGTWPQWPGDHYIAGMGENGPPPEKAWFSLVAVTPLEDASEAVVWIAAHELFHYLRATRQIPGRNTEIEADAFADDMLSEFRRKRARGNTKEP